MSFKRIMGVFLSGIIAVSALSGCNGNTSVKNVEKNAEEKEPDKRPVVTVMTNTYCEDDLAVVEQACPDIDIRWFPWCVNSGEVPKGYYERLYNNDIMPDIVLGNSLIRYDNDDSRYFRDLSGEDVLANINTGLLSNYFTDDGKIYWIPNMVEYTAVALNDKMFEENGIELPSDFEGILAAAKSFQEKGIKSVSIDFGTTGISYRSWSVICAVSADLLQNVHGRQWSKNYASFTDDTILDSGENAIWPQIFERLIELKDAGILTQEHLATDTTTMLNSLTGDISPMIIMDSKTYASTEAQSGRHFTLKPFYNASDTNGWLIVNTVPRYAVSNKVTDDRMEDVMRVLSALCSQEVYEAHIAGRGGIIDPSQRGNISLKNKNEAIYDTLDDGNLLALTTDDGLNAASVAVIEAICTKDITAEQAYDLFVQTVKETRANKTDTSAETMFDISGAGYSNLFDMELGARPAASALCNTMLKCEEFQTRGIDVMIANADIMNMPMLDGKYTTADVGYLFSNQRLYTRTMTAGELVKILNVDMYLTHRILQNMPVMAGASYELEYKKEGWTNDELGVTAPETLASIQNSSLGPKQYRVKAIRRGGDVLPEDTKLTVAATRVEMFYLANPGKESTFEGWEDFDEPYKFCHQYLQKYLEDGGEISEPLSYLDPPPYKRTF